MSQDIHYLSLLDVSERIRRGELTSLAVTETLLQRIEWLGPKLRCFVMVLQDDALAAAHRADREIASGFWRGPLHGVPIGIKDILYTKGAPTSAGMDLLREVCFDEDATVVTRLKDAGAVLIGKLHMTEGAGLTHHPAMPPPVNPWSAAHWTGVSSSGSGVAVAAGLCYGAIGTDTGGSIRMPSAANGLTGIKPTWGRVSRHGVVPLVESLDHIGPIARSTADAAAILQAIAGVDPNDPTCLDEPVPDYLADPGAGIGDLSVGIDRDIIADTAPEIEQSIAEAEAVLRRLGCRVREIEFPQIGGLMGGVTMPLIAETAVAHAPYFPEQADRYGPRFRRMLEAAQSLDGRTVANAYLARDRFSGQMRSLFRDVDLVLVPALGRVLPTWDEFETLQDDMKALAGGLMRFLSPFNISGAPTITLPAGFTQSGLPLGIQLAAWRLGEPLLCRAGAAFQRATDHHIRRPSL